jgi:glycosyltransferase involved in cell wall biosynthesis
MRILICNWKDRFHPRAGGAEVWTHGVAGAWTDAGHDVTLACSVVPDRPARELIDGVEVVRGGDYRCGVHRHVRRVYEARNGNFDLVLDEVNTRPFQAPKWARRSEVLAFVHQVAREVWFHETPLPVAVLGRYVLEPWWLRTYRDVRTYVDGPSTAASLADYGLRDVVPLPMGSTLDVRSFPKESSPTFVWVGRMCSMKRPEHAMQAFELAAAALPGARLWMMGTGPLEEKLRKRAPAGVEVLGRVSANERDERLGRAHYLLATSVREGWGLTVSEAAAVGTSAISYDAPGLVDSVRATGGELVAPRPEALAEAMVRAASDLSRVRRPIGHGTVPWAEVAAALLGDAGRCTADLDESVRRPEMAR